MDTNALPRPRKGRGAVTNPANRFESCTSELLDEFWQESGEPIETTLTRDSTRHIITRNTSPDVPFDRSINPYRGCEHGCIYCFARPTHAFLGLSPGLDFETRLFYKPDAASLLKKELGARNYRCDVMAIGTNTDPYQPVERRLGITREILEVLHAHRHPVSIVTKSALVTRDADILAQMAEMNLAKVMVSVTTLDRGLSRILEPRAPGPARRLETIRRLVAEGIPTGVLAAPMIPALNDSELEAIIEASHDAGAVTVGYVLLRLPLELKALFSEWLETHMPLRAKHVLNAIRETRNGALYENGFGKRMKGSGVYAELIRQRFDKASKRFDLDRPGPLLDTSQFLPFPEAATQLDLFDPLRDPHS